MKLAAFYYITILVHASLTKAFVSNNLRGAAIHKRLDTNKLYGEVSDEMHENFRKLGFGRPKPIRRSAVSDQESLDSPTNARKTFQASIKNAYHKPMLQLHSETTNKKKKRFDIPRAAVSDPTEKVKEVEEVSIDEMGPETRRMHGLKSSGKLVRNVLEEIALPTEYYNEEFLLDDEMKIPKKKPIIRPTAVGPPRNEESIRDRIMKSFRRPCDIDINDADININTEYYELEFLIET